MYLSWRQPSIFLFLFTLTLATGCKEEEKMEVTISPEVNLSAEATGKFDSNFFWTY